MTRNRVPYRGLGLIAAAMATMISTNVFPQQAGTATWQNLPSGATSCTYSSITTLPSGQVAITCNTVTANTPGALGFSAISYPDAAKSATAAASFNVFVQRMNGTTGTVTGTVVSATTGVCTVPNGAVTFADGVANPVTVAVSGATTGTCTLNFTLGTGTTGDPTAGINMTTTILVKDAATLPPPITGCDGITPTTNFVQHTDFGAAGQRLNLTAAAGVIHSWPLPRTAAGVQATSALISHTMLPGTPQEVSLEWSISRCPGDVNYGKSAAAAYVSTARGGTGVTYYPCSKPNGIESGGINYATTASAQYCAVPVPAAGATGWYVNLRLLSGTAACPGGLCTFTYQWF